MFRKKILRLSVWCSTVANALRRTIHGHVYCTVISIHNLQNGTTRSNGLSWRKEHDQNLNTKLVSYYYLLYWFSLSVNHFVPFYQGYHML